MEAEEGRPGLQSGQAPRSPSRAASQTCGSLLFKHITVTETGLVSDVVLHGTRALVEQEQAVARECGPEREGPILHSHETSRAGSPPCFWEEHQLPACVWTGLWPLLSTQLRQGHSASVGGFTPKTVLREKCLLITIQKADSRSWASETWPTTRARLLAEAHYLCGPEGQWQTEQREHLHSYLLL